jgi:plastocyanin
MFIDAARIVRPAFVLALIVFGLVSAPTAVAGNPCFRDPPPPRTTGTDPEIKAAPCAFLPAVTHVGTGSTVTFFNGPTFTHLITGANQEWGSPDAELRPGQTVAYRFDEPGVYPFACALHAGMSGTIVVGDPTAALAPGTAADTSSGSTGVTGPTAARPAASAPPATPTGTAEATTASLPLGALALVSALAAGAGALVGAAIASLGLSRLRTSERAIRLPD